MSQPKVGEELDEIIAKQVMNWKCSEPHCDGVNVIFCMTCGKAGHGNCYGMGRGGEVPGWPCNHWPNYSMMIEDAWKVVEKNPVLFSLKYNRISGMWIANFRTIDLYSSAIFEAQADTAPHAICLAAIRGLSEGLI